MLWDNVDSIGMANYLSHAKLYACDICGWATKYKQLLDSVSVICRIINVEVRVISRARNEGDNFFSETLIILHITKTEFNNCFIIHFQRKQLKNGML